MGLNPFVVVVVDLIKCFEVVSHHHHTRYLNDFLGRTLLSVYSVVLS